MNSGDYILNVDWLTLYGIQHLSAARDALTPRKSYGWDSELQHPADTLSKADRIKLEGIEFAGKQQHVFGNLILDVQDYGTRQFSVLTHVYWGRERFAILAAFPRMANMDPECFQLKVENMWLYKDDCYRMLAYVLGTLHLEVRHISRLDLCADFNSFHGDLHPIEFIRRFMAGEIKHKGRSHGRVYFRQEAAPAGVTAKCGDVLNFNALEFGKHSSDARVYLYNKSLELSEEKQKPWIQDCWRAAGLNVDDVWRLEISMNREALTFVDRSSGTVVSFNLANLTDTASDVTPAVLYHTMLRSLFFFFVPNGGRNISRQRMLQLFDDELQIIRGTYREKNPSDRSERILIKQLFTVRDRYRYITLEEEFRSRMLAQRLAESMNLGEWYARKCPEWKNEKLKV